MMIASEHTATEFALPSVDAQALLRRMAIPVAAAAAIASVLLLAGGRVDAFAAAIRRGLSINAGWAGAAGAFEFLSLAGYVALLSLVAGRETPRVRVRESAQITLAGAAATRLLPTAGAGGVALALWALRWAGLTPRAATRTLLVFMIVLYSVFLCAIVAAGAVLAIGVVHGNGPAALAAVPASIALLVIVAFVALAARRGTTEAPHAADCETRQGGDPPSRAARLRRAGRVVGDAMGDAYGLVRRGDPRLAGAFAYWAFDAAVLWAMLHAFGSAPVVPVVALAYFVGQVANTVPIPGSVSGGMTGVLIAFGVSAELALPAVLAYRAISVWLPAPVALASIPALRATLARWGREDVLSCA